MSQFDPSLASKVVYREADHSLVPDQDTLLRHKSALRVQSFWRGNRQRVAYHAMLIQKWQEEELARELAE